jgi:Lipocalin-like domain
MIRIFAVLGALLSAQLLGFDLLGSAAAADDREKLLGNWKLVSFFTEDVDSKQRNDVYGERPNGYIGFTPAGRFFAFATADGRKSPQNPEEQAAAFRYMIAYTGKFRLEGDKFITKVDVAWNEGWVGTEQVRFWRVEEGKLHIISAPIPNPNVPGGKMIGILVWERE